MASQTKSKNKNKNQAKLTRAQKTERIKAAQERERIAQEKREAAERTKRIFTIVVCIILVLALGIPTIALSVLQF